MTFPLNIRMFRNGFIFQPHFGSNVKLGYFFLVPVFKMLHLTLVSLRSGANMYVELQRDRW